METAMQSAPRRNADTNAIKEFLQLESAGGIVLIIATVLAMIAANTPLQHWYKMLQYRSATLPSTNHCCCGSTMV